MFFFCFGKMILESVSIENDNDNMKKYLDDFVIYFLNKFMNTNYAVRLFGHDIVDIEVIVPCTGEVDRDTRIL